MTNKETILQWVREKNPQTMELKFGCRLKHGAFESLYIHGDKVFISGALEQSTIDMESWKLLGSDMGLLEFCNALMKSGCYFVMNHNFNIKIQDKHRKETYCVEFDETKNLHEQSEEFYESILPLIILPLIND